MAIANELTSRSGGRCELCSREDSELSTYTIPPESRDPIENQVTLCGDCFSTIKADDISNMTHWRFLEGSIWSEVPAVQVLSYKLLGKLSDEEWARDAMESAFLDESLIEWAGAEERLKSEKIVHKDSYGVLLEGGDTVILTENLNVKGTNYIAPKGTIVRKIKLVPHNAEQVEGKINGDTIVILTKFLRKSS